MSDKRFDQFPGVSELNDNDILVGWKTNQAKNINFTMGDLMKMITQRPMNFGDKIVISPAGDLYIKSNGLSGTAYFFKMVLDDFGNIPQPLESTGFTTIEDLIASL